jgi:hypothetical protein
MMPIGRLIPVESRRTRHTLRARVIAHTIRKTGWWVFKKTYPSIKIQFTPDEYAKFCHILEHTRDFEGRTFSNPPIEFEVGMTSVEERDQYLRGEEVEVLFSTSNAIDGFFTGAELFRWDGIQKINSSSATSSA